LGTDGFAGPDALQPAAAEKAGADVRLNTDERFFRTANRQRRRLRGAVNSPWSWLRKV
jgi:hypothetical protein